jgi:tetratricopeptide (TPR) repeat protein
VAQSYRWLGNILLGRGEITILEWASENLRLAQIAGERRILADSLLGYAGALLKQPNDATKYVEEADSLFKQVGSPLNSSDFLLAELEWLKGEHETAKQIYLAVEERYGVLGEKYMRSDAIADLGLLAMEDRKLSEAQEYFERALITAEELEDQVFISWRLAELARLFYLLGNMDKFKEKLRGSVSSAKNISPFQKIHPLVLMLSTIYSQKPDISTRVIGAINVFIQKVGGHIFDPRPLEQYYDRAEEHTRRVLGNAAFESAFAEGEKLSLDEGLDLVLKTVEEM